MRLRSVSAIGLTAGALTLPSMPSAVATAATPSSPAHITAVGPSTAAAGPTRILATKCGTAYGTFAGTATAQHFGPTLPADSFGGKEVRCTGNKAARTITQITVAGGGPAMDIKFNVAVYADRAAGPVVRQPPKKRHQPNDNKAPVCSYADAAGTYSATGPSGQEWTIALSKPCTLSKKLGKKGAWIDLQADLDFGTFGQWFWAVQTTPDVNEGDWRNPDNLFGTNCLTYQVTPPVAPDIGYSKVVQDCLFGAGGPTDWMMTVA